MINQIPSLDAETIARKISAIATLPQVASVREWKGKRVYVNVDMSLEPRASYRGEANYELWVDLASGALISRAGKGMYRSAFIERVRAVESAWAAA